jgi:hypothetical protein
MIRSPLSPSAYYWASKLREAAAELREAASRCATSQNLAGRLERHAQAILFPELPRGWADAPSVADAAAPAGGDD